MKMQSSMAFLSLSLLTLMLGCRHESKPEAVGDLESVTSPFVSSIDGVDVKNAHIVVQDKHGDPDVIRSQAPKTQTDFRQFKEFGVTDIVIFKRETGNEVSTEVAKWKDLAITSNHIKHIPIDYINFPNFKTPCSQTIEALSFIHRARSREDSRVLIHCTVGEDRTGYLSGLVVLMDGERDLPEIFKNEMCKHGYSGGDPNKPRTLASQIDRDLTPVFLKMAYFIKSGQLSWKKIDPEICGRDPERDPEYVKNAAYDLTGYTCSKASRR